tara:strand:- start:358 stop:630 length:273 start_codon:yes stop_codon:yes gene_type:complete
MSRYRKSAVRKDANGVRYYSPSFVSNIPLKDSDIYVFPFDGDRLDMLAQRYYNDSNLWWIIAKANNISNGTFGLDPEIKIRIPIEIQNLI